MAVNYTVRPSLLRQYFDHLQNNQLDIRKLVCCARNLLILAKPIVDVVTICQKIARWEIFWATAAILAVCNISCLLLPPLYSTLSVLLVICGLFSIGLGHQKHGILVKAFPSPSRLDNDDEKLEHHECIQEFHLLLVVMDELILHCSYIILRFYSVLKLEDWNFSLKCYAVMFCVVLFLFLLPFRIFVVLLIDLAIIYQPVTEWLMLMKPNWFESSLQASSVKAESLTTSPSSGTTNVRNSSIQSDDAVSQSSDIQLDPGFGTDSEGSEKLQSDSSSGDEMTETLSVSGDSTNAQKMDPKPDTSSKTSGVVGRLLDLKKRRPAIKERCTGCGVMFTTILKRRHICINCGSYFCSRCCSHKVPRSTFGATAPAAQTETVAVCLTCYCLLTGKDKLS